MKNKGKHCIIMMVHCCFYKHNVLKFPEYSEQLLSDASEINILVNILKKNQLSTLNNLYAVLNFSRLMTNVYGSANINKKPIKYHHIHFLILSTMRN